GASGSWRGLYHPGGLLRGRRDDQQGGPGRLVRPAAADADGDLLGDGQRVSVGVVQAHGDVVGRVVRRKEQVIAPVREGARAALRILRPIDVDDDRRRACAPAGDRGARRVLDLPGDVEVRLAVGVVVVAGAGVDDAAGGGQG